MIDVCELCALNVTSCVSLLKLILIEDEMPLVENGFPENIPFCVVIFIVVNCNFFVGLDDAVPNLLDFVIFKVVLSLFNEVPIEVVLLLVSF